MKLSFLNSIKCKCSVITKPALIDSGIEYSYIASIVYELVISRLFILEDHQGFVTRAIWNFAKVRLDPFSNCFNIFKKPKHIKHPIMRFRKNTDKNTSNSHMASLIGRLVGLGRSANYFRAISYSYFNNFSLARGAK